jgi:hypothetical protein
MLNSANFLGNDHAHQAFTFAQHEPRGRLRVGGEELSSNAPRLA